jgi:hypothetical protein
MRARRNRDRDGVVDIRDRRVPLDRWHVRVRLDLAPCGCERDLLLGPGTERPGSAAKGVLRWRTSHTTLSSADGTRGTAFPDTLRGCTDRVAQPVWR